MHCLDSSRHLAYIVFVIFQVEAFVCKVLYPPTLIGREYMEYAGGLQTLEAGKLLH